MNDIRDIDDIKKMVNHFYMTVKTDELLGPIFKKHIPEATWQSHMDVIYNFWESILFDKLSYKANAFIKHINLNIEQKHFDAWLLQFNESVDTQFKGPVADKAKARAASIAMLFQHKLKQM